ncbi:hypothetical protein GCM10023264_03990 [Sphingomonas daechungensis]
MQNPSSLPFERVEVFEGFGIIGSIIDDQDFDGWVVHLLHAIDAIAKQGELIACRYDNGDLSRT